MLLHLDDIKISVKDRLAEKVTDTKGEHVKTMKKNVSYENQSLRVCSFDFFLTTFSYVMYNVFQITLLRYSN